MNNLKVLAHPNVTPHLEGYDVRALVDDPDGPLKAGQVGSIVDVSVSADGNHQYVVMPRGLDAFDYSVLTHTQVAAHDSSASFPANALEPPLGAVPKRTLPELQQKSLIGMSADHKVPVILPKPIKGASNKRKSRKAKDLEPPLYFSARRGNYQKLEHRLKLGDDPNMTYPELQYESPLIAAVQHHHTKCVELLLDYGADANIKDKTGRYLLALALVWGQEQPEVCRLLMTHGARPDVDYWPNKTIAQLAFSQTKIDRVGARGKQAFAIVRDTCYANNLIPLTNADPESADYSKLKD